MNRLVQRFVKFRQFEVQRPSQVDRHEGVGGESADGLSELLMALELHRHVVAVGNEAEAAVLEIFQGVDGFEWLEASAFFVALLEQSEPAVTQIAHHHRGADVEGVEGSLDGVGCSRGVLLNEYEVLNEFVRIARRQAEQVANVLVEIARRADPSGCNENAQGSVAAEGLGGGHDRHG